MPWLRERLLGGSVLRWPFQRHSDWILLDYQDYLKDEIRQNFTKAECELSLLHQPQDQSPISPFDPSFCDPPEPGVAGGFNGPADEFPLLFLSATTGVSSLSPKSLLGQNSECSFSFYKRPSLARPGNLICCQLIRASWRWRRIAVCPNSCDGIHVVCPSNTWNNPKVGSQMR